MIQPIKALKQKQVVEMVVKGSTRIIVNLSVGILLLTSLFMSGKYILGNYEFRIIIETI